MIICTCHIILHMKNSNHKLDIKLDISLGDAHRECLLHTSCEYWPVLISYSKQIIIHYKHIKLYIITIKSTSLVHVILLAVVQFKRFRASAVMSGKTSTDFRWGFRVQSCLRTSNIYFCLIGQLINILYFIDISEINRGHQ